MARGARGAEGRARVTTRTQLESLVWRETHPDFRGKNQRGERTVLYYEPAHGSCLVRVQDMTLGELLDKLPSKWRVQLGCQLWRLVLGPDSRVLGVFGYGLVKEQEDCRRRVERQARVVVRSLLWAGPRPKVGDVVDDAAQSLVPWD